MERVDAIKYKGFLASNQHFRLCKYLAILNSGKRGIDCVLPLEI